MKFIILDEIPESDYYKENGYWSSAEIYHQGQQSLLSEAIDEQDFNDIALGWKHSPLSNIHSTDYKPLSQVLAEREKERC